jgi:hypothetical protein
VISQRLSEFAEIPFFALVFTLFPIHETATEAVTTVFEKLYIFYYRIVVNFSVYSLDAFLAQKIWSSNQKSI